jgi:hypothetical protein
MEEIADRETKLVLEEGSEHHNFICVECRELLTSDRGPL